MALSKLTYNSLNVTAAASKAVGFDSGADDLSASLSGGSMVFIKKLTADGSAGTLSFVDGSDDVVLDNTYKEYIFIFNNLHPSNNSPQFSFQANAAGGSGYNETITSTSFYSYLKEDDTDNAFSYRTAADQAQGTSFQQLTVYGIGYGNDSSLDGYLHLYDPSNTTFVKHFTSRVINEYDSSAAYAVDAYAAGYFNTTSAIDEIQFKLAAGNFDAGTITLYGIS
tara:strand:+ start:159 stop:830 length:672 start_codon:yes stop_codon:yes gene_type:complete